MSIITISRGSYSNGKAVAEALAEELNFECISREIVDEASREFNIPQNKLTRAMHDAPSLLHHFHNVREVYINYFKSAFFEHMQRGNIVYHGHAGHYFLQDISHVLKVRINARLEDRAAEEVRRENCTMEQAVKRIKKDDRDRRMWSKQVYGCDPWDSRLYDLVLCVDSLSVNDVVDILAHTVKKQQFQETESSLAQLNSLALDAQATALISPVSPGAQVKIRDKSHLEVSHIDGLLKTDKEVRDKLADRLKEKLHVETVDYKEPFEYPKDHINTFYNLELH